MKKTILSISLLLIVFSCKNENQAVTDLKLKLPKDFEQTLIYETDTNENTDTALHEVNVVNYKLDSTAKNGDYYITGKVKRVNYNQNILGDSYAIDTREAKKDTTGLDSEIKNMVDKEFFFKINVYGKIIGKPKFKNFKGDPSFIEQYSILPFALPEEKVFETLKWEETTSNPIDKSVELKSTYTIEKIDDNSVSISYSGLMGYHGSSDKYKTEMKGSFVLDKKTGVLMSGEKSMNIDKVGEIKFKISPKIKGFD